MDPIGQVVSLQNYDWHVQQPLASGGFGSVYLASAVGQPPAVIKLVGKDPGAERELLFENLEGVPHVVPVLDRGEWEDYWVLAMPQAERSLREHLTQVGGPMSAPEAVAALADVVEALVALEGNVVHRDIKPENVLLLDGRWHLADFGISKYAEATTAPDTRKFAMSPPYAAPEQWRGDTATSATDVYAIGVVAYEMLSGRRPFVGPTTPDFRMQHLEVDPDPIGNVPPSLESLVQECLFKGQGARPRPQNLLERLRKGVDAPSGAAQSLREANMVAVRTRAEEERQKSAVRSAQERRAELWDAADHGFANVVRHLRDQVLENAPASNLDTVQAALTCGLNGASLTVVHPKSLGIDDDNSNELPFAVAQYAAIGVATPRNGSGYEGRSHSLWFCDAQEPGFFRWYETAFMTTPGLVRVRPRRAEPFHLDPGKDASLALRRGVEVLKVAWPFTPIDQGQELDFVERWMSWFAAAAKGELRQPRHMPEGNPSGSWRVSD